MIGENMKKNYECKVSRIKKNNKCELPNRNIQGVISHPEMEENKKPRILIFPIEANPRASINFIF